MSDLKFEVVLISGANSPMEIGAAVASAPSVKGADCFLTYLTGPGQLKDVSAWVYKASTGIRWSARLWYKQGSHRSCDKGNNS
jgi:hypothetical protein